MGMTIGLYIWHDNHLVEHFELKQKQIIYFVPRWVEVQKRQRKYFFFKIKQMAKKKKLDFFQISGLIIICKFSCEDDGFMNMLN